MPRNSRSMAQKQAARKRRRKGDARLAARMSSVPATEAPLGQPAARAPEPSNIETDGASMVRARSTTVRRGSTFETTNYSYVAKDLQRVAMVGGSLLAGLIILSLLIR